MILLLLALSGSLAFGDRIPMKVIEHAASPSGAGLSGGSLGITTNTPDLSSMIPPARHNEFTGPEDLRPLVGRCMTTVQRNYHWRVCPFDNVTQADLSSAWGAYRGTLGVFEQWTLDLRARDDDDSSRAAPVAVMQFTNGDACSASIRRSEVHFSCGPEEKIRTVDEIQTCVYELYVETPLWCNASLLVDHAAEYICNVNATAGPFSDELDAAIALLDERLDEGELTGQGYRRRKLALLQRHGVCEGRSVERTAPVPATADSSSYSYQYKYEPARTLYDCELDLVKVKRQLERAMQLFNFTEEQLTEDESASNDEVVSSGVEGGEGSVETNGTGVRVAGNSTVVEEESARAIDLSPEQQYNASANDTAAVALTDGENGAGVPAEGEQEEIEEGVGVEEEEEEGEKI